MSTPIVSIRNVSKRFGAIEALKDISIDIQAGEIFALLGPSGCGKSTLLRIISGFESPSGGELLLDGEDMTRLPPNKRPVNMVFQSYAVFPHMSVADNVGYGLKMDGLARETIDERVEAALRQVHLDGLGERQPDQLSGGQRQRVALARALIKQPRVLLLDEPLSALDAKLRDAMRLELVKLQEEVGITFVIVTHDQSEALAMADRIAVLEGGRMRQLATPQALYQQPVDVFVADFIGTAHRFDVTRIDVVGHEATSDTGSGSESIEIEAERIGRVHLDRALPDEVASGEQSAGTTALMVRPEAIEVSLDEAPAGRIALEGRLGDIAFQGQHCIVEVRFDGELPSLTAVLATAPAATLQSARIDTPVIAHWDAADMHLLPHRSRAH